MATEYGHVKISRKAYASDPFWSEAREFSRWEAWEWMIQAAAWKPYKKVTRRAGVVAIERGETPPLAERFLADTWGWASKNRARRFLEQLQEMGRIRTGQRTAEGTTYHLVNYDTYQGGGVADGPESEPQADHTRTGDGPHADQNRSSKADLSNELTTARETPEEVEAAKAEMRADANRYAPQIPAGPIRTAFNAEVRAIVEGEMSASWKSGRTGLPLPWAVRPARLRMAMDALIARRAQTLHFALVHVHSREDDPLEGRSSEEIRTSRPGRPGAVEPTAGPPPAPAPTAEEREAQRATEEEQRARRRASEDERISAWAAAHELEAARLKREIRESVAFPPQMEHLRERTIEETYRTRVLALLREKTHAA